MIYEYLISGLTKEDNWRKHFKTLAAEGKAGNEKDFIYLRRAFLFDLLIFCRAVCGYKK